MVNCGSACFYDGHGLELLRMMSLPFANHMVHSCNRCPTNEMADNLVGHLIDLFLCIVRMFERSRFFFVFV